MGQLELYLGTGKRRGNDPLHWILILKPPGSSKCTWYHVTGGPTQKKSYKLEIQNDKRFDSFGISDHYYIGDIDENDQNKFKASTKKISGRRCQEWSVAVLYDAEKKGLVPKGTGDYWFQRVENSPYSTDGYHHTQEQPGSSSSGGKGSSSSTWGRKPSSSSSSSSSNHAKSSNPKNNSETSASSSNSGWVWDEKYGQHRYWDSRCGRWVWQSERR